MLLVLLAGVIPYAIIVPSSSFPSAGVAFALALLATVVYGFFSRRDTYASALFAAVLGFCLFIFIRANMLLTFFNIGATLYTGAAMIVYKKYGKLTFPYVVFAPIIAVVDAVNTKPIYHLGHVKEKVSANVKNVEKITSSFLPIIVTIILLLVIIPLLSYANPIFGKMVQSVLNTLNLAWWVRAFLHDPLYVARIVFFLVLVFFIPRLVTTVNTESKPLLSGDPFGFRMAATLPKIAVAVVLGVFFIAQMQLYFATPATLVELGYTNSRLTNEVFGQLAVVLGIIFVLIYNDKQRTKLSKILTYLLLLEGLFLGIVTGKQIGRAHV